MIYYSYELDNLVRASNFVPYKIHPGTRYEEGKYYWCGYWHQWYKVLNVKYINGRLMHVTVKWQDERITEHRTPLDPLHDYELRETILDPRFPVVNSNRSYKAAEIKAMCCLGYVEEDTAQDLMVRFYFGEFKPNDEVYYFVFKEYVARMERDLLKSPRCA